MTFSLIANSGIQFHRFEITIDPNAEVIGTMGFHEYEDLLNARISIENAFFLPDQDFWVPKQVLQHHGYLDGDGNLHTDIVNLNEIKGFRLKEDKDYFTVGDIQTCLEYFLSKDDEVIWLPVPFFKRTNNAAQTFGPIAWARMMIKEIPAENAGGRKNINQRSKIAKYHIVLAFDTKLAEGNASYYAPTIADTKEQGNQFLLCNNEDLLLNFCNTKYHCGWVNRYIKDLVQTSEPQQFPRQQYIGYYIYFVKYLASLFTKTDDAQIQPSFPEVVLYSDQNIPVEVDLVLDIGNSNTCGILFEHPSPHRPFNLTSAKKLKINDLTQPEKEYTDPFSMRLVFAEARFGKIYSDYNNFRWPSLLRLGSEASRLISKYTVNKDRGFETATHHSSPKRYLWDNKRTDVPWEFINFSGQNVSDAVYYEGISEQFKENGEFAHDGAFASLPFYSRKSLMIFVFIEVLLHAIAQANSHEFRTTHGSSEIPRKIKRLTITCPTSIIQKEQFILRECAEIAVRVLGRFFSDTFLGTYDEDDAARPDLEIVPSPKDLLKKRDQSAFRKDWIYDEATCGQLVFIYGEVSRRYLNNADLFFRLYGKYRDDVSNTDTKALTIGTIDIGGGTTDLMICAYQHESDQNLAVIKPHPLYWESFNFAGDDLLKEIVQQVLLEGNPKGEAEIGCVGVLSYAAKKAGVTQVSEKMLRFFGPDSNKQGYTVRTNRKNFVVQIAVPIALHYLQHAIDDKPDEEIKFIDFFPDVTPNHELVQFFNQTFFPLRLEDVTFKLSKKRVFDIVELTFDPLLRQLSGMISAYGCDFLLLAGKPTTIPKIREMLVRYYPVSPDRIITLNNQYRVGRWYPFADDLGYIEDPKTVVAVGALIALMGGKLDGLDGFRINTQLLRQRLESTADYIGTLNFHTQLIDAILISPGENNNEIIVHSLPLTLGYKQLPNKHYRGKPIYKLEWNNEEIMKRVIEQNPILSDNEQDVENAMQHYKVTLKNSMPFRVKLQRNWSESKETLTISRVLDANKNERSRQMLSLSIMTLADEYSYWLDTGEFILNLR
ncbi:hypothetical protein EXU85_03620 [Spirosoma sp. KCTC 42546]|nr:hypothetical protein EXU85_03620 [Spirosoma sp. KCTC 42546]